jgi:hypothetical protein
MSPSSANVRKAFPLPRPSKWYAYGMQPVEIKYLQKDIIGEYFDRRLVVDFVCPARFSNGDLKRSAL